MLCQCRPVPRHFGSLGWERQPHTSQQSKLLQYKFESYFRLIFFPLSFFVGRLFAWRWSASRRSSFPGSFSRRSNPGILCCYEVNFTLPSTKTRQEIPLDGLRVSSFQYYFESVELQYEERDKNDLIIYDSGKCCICVSSLKASSCAFPDKTWTTVICGKSGWYLSKSKEVISKS